MRSLTFVEGDNAADPDPPPPPPPPRDLDDWGRQIRGGGGKIERK